MRDGFAGQEWLDEFKAEVPAVFEELASSGDPQTAAARILQQFQAGLRPELLDRDQVKERVRQMLLGDASMSELATQIASELSAEMGVSLGQAQQAVGSLLGTGGGMTAAGTGLDGATAAEQFTDSWVSMFGGMITRFTDSGANAGTAWTGAFIGVVESGIPPAVLNALAMQVTPAVLAAIASGQSRTGAQ